jgi:hypothetical protein
MKYLVFVIFWICFYQIFGLEFEYKENVKFQKLNQNNKVLIDFEFRFEHPANLK